MSTTSNTMSTMYTMSTVFTMLYNLSLGSNYRGISLSSLVAKTYNRMNRIRPHLDCHLKKNQNGFRSGRTTTS